MTTDNLILRDMSRPSAADVAEQLSLEAANPAVRTGREKLGLTVEEAAVHSRNARAARNARR